MAYKKCRWLEVPEGARLTVRDMCRCRWPLPELPDYPVSITRSYRGLSIPDRRFVSKEDCAECPCFEVEPDRGAGNADPA